MKPNRKLLAEKGVGLRAQSIQQHDAGQPGAAPVIEERAAGVAVGLGTDGPLPAATMT